jgi:hypothetical protein
MEEEKSTRAQEMATGRIGEVDVNSNEGTAVLIKSRTAERNGAQHARRTL